MVKWRSTIPTESPVVIDADAPILCNISRHVFSIYLDIYLWYILTYILYLDIYPCSIFISGRSSIQAWLQLRRDWATGKLIASRTSLSLSDLYPWQFTLAQSNWQNRLQWWYPTTPSLKIVTQDTYEWTHGGLYLISLASDNFLFSQQSTGHDQHYLLNAVYIVFLPHKIIFWSAKGKHQRPGSDG